MGNGNSLKKTVCCRFRSSLDDGSILFKLYGSPDGRDGVEFQTDVAPIDILATSAAGNFYVLELNWEKALMLL